MTALLISNDTRRVVDLSVLMPCYNDGANLAKNIESTLEDLEHLARQTYELIVIDDGSTDATYKEASRIASTNRRVSVLRVKANSGKGSALQAGFEASKGGLICFLDGDLQISARHIPRFVEYMRFEKADIVIASKRHPLSSVDYPRTRRILSRCYQTLITVLFRLPLTDTQTGLKLFRREVLERVFPKALVKRYAFDVELLGNAHRLGYRIVEAPIEVSGRGIYKSHVDLGAVWRMFYDTLGIFYRMYIRAYYDGVADGILSRRKIAILGEGGGSLAALRYLTRRGIGAYLLPISQADPAMNAPEGPRAPHLPITVVCVDDDGEESVQPNTRELDPYLEVLARTLKGSNDYTCFAFAGSLYPGVTERVIIPYLEHRSLKRVQEDFDVVVLPSFEEVGGILPESQQPQTLIIGSTSIKGLSVLSGFLKELEPIMLRAEPTTAEVVQRIRKVARSNAIPVMGKILEICELANVDADRAIRAADLWSERESMNSKSRDGNRLSPSLDP